MKLRSTAFFSTSCRENAGMALVMSLFIIVLITAVVLAFYAKATSNRLIEASRSNHIGAEDLEKTAADYVTSAFLQEIVTHSITNVICLPNSSSFAVPQRPLPGTMGADTNFANLLRGSFPDVSTNGVTESNASAHSTATASGNGRIVGASRWNATMLLPAGFNNTNQLPNWIYVNADGSASATPGTNAVGRFAYIVYDVGGLLDANVAGYPAAGPYTTSAADISQLKGTLAGANLSVIPGITNADAFVQWRNATSAATAANYLAYASSYASKGFLQGTSGDNRITSRKDLINLAAAGHGITTEALPYLTHFTRELARPSLTTNGLMNMTSRYDLSQLASLANTGLIGIPGTATNWAYSNAPVPTLTSSNSLASPNLFQVLRSAITYTNSWETNGPAVSGNFSSTAWSTNLDLRAVAIGANVIDQFAGTSEPTRILLGTERVAGKKPLPMVMQVFLAYNISTNSSGTNNVNFSVIPQVWSPPPGPSMSSNITASLISGQIVVNGYSTTALPSGPITCTNSILPGATPSYADPNPASNPALRGFFPTSVPLTNATPASLDVTFKGLTFIFKTAGTTNTYSAFGNATSDLSSAALTGTVTLTNAISSSSTLPSSSSSNGLAGIAIQTVDPKTLQLAGTNALFSGSWLLTTALPIGVLTNYGGTITDTDFPVPTTRIMNVGELGRVYRESPWRTMDFVTANSPDKAVLDAFSAFSTPPGGVRAGVINLNTRQSVVLEAILSGTGTVPSDSASLSTLSTNVANSFATNMVAYTATNALTNRSQLVDLVANNILANPVATDPQKAVREAAVRALGEVGQTRTWNLMFDIVAQSGSFPPSSCAAGSFRVQGEQRRWTHIAIDRPTAKVIDQTTEIISE